MRRRLHTLPKMLAVILHSLASIHKGLSLWLMVIDWISSISIGVTFRASMRSLDTELCIGSIIDASSRCQTIPGTTLILSASWLKYSPSPVWIPCLVYSWNKCWWIQAQPLRSLLVLLYYQSLVPLQALLSLNLKALTKCKAYLCMPWKQLQIALTAVQ